MATVKKNKVTHNKVNKDSLIVGDILHVDISLKTFLIALGLIAAVLIVFQIKVIFLLLFISFILMSAFRPLVYKLVEGRISKEWAIVIVYGLVLLGFITIFTAVSIPLIQESSKLVRDLPSLVENLKEKSSAARDIVGFLNLEVLLSHISENLSNGVNFDNVQAALNGVFGAFGIIISAVTVFVISAFMVAQRNQILNDVLHYIPQKETRKDIRRLLVSLEQNLGLWLRGWLLHVFSVFVIVFIILSIIGVPFALPLAVLTGLLEIVPSLGTIFAVGPILLVTASTGSFAKVIAVLVAYVIFALVDGNFLTPTIMKKVVGLNPLTTLIAILVGAELAGTLGVLIAVPSVVVLKVILNFWVSKERNKEREIQSL